MHSGRDPLWDSDNDAVFAAVPDALFIYQPESETLIATNPAMDVLFDLSARKTPDLGLPDLFSDWEGSAAPELRRAAATAALGRPTSIRLTCTTGARKSLAAELTLSRLRSGERILVRVRDLSAEEALKYHTEKRLRLSEGRFRTLIDGAQVSIGISQYGKPIYANPYYLRSYGYDSFDEIRELNSLDMIAPSHREEIAVRSSKRDSGVSAEDSYETMAVRKDGSEFPIQVSATRVVLDTGPAVVFIAIDISAWKKAEAELVAAQKELEKRVEIRTEELRKAMTQVIQSEKLASLGSLVAGVAHELSTPIGNSLTVVTALESKSTAMRESYESSRVSKSALETFLDTVNSAGALLEGGLRRAAQIVENFKLLASDQTSTQRRNFSLGEIIGEIIEARRPSFEHEGLRIEAETAPGLSMESYPGSLRQVLNELIENTRLHAFSERKGTVRISARASHEDHVIMICEDDGDGIPKEYHKKLFDPFFTTRLGLGRNGLGLYIVFSIVTGSLGGSIRFESVPGHGTRFELDLPRRAPEMAA